MISMKKILVFAMLLFMILGVASAVDVDSSSADISATSSVVSNDVVETQESSLQMEDDVEDNTDPGANPTQYNTLNESQTYNNAIITLNDSQAFTDATVTFNNNVTLTSDSTTKTLTNLKVVITGTNVTINNVNFNHQTNTDTKVIDVTSTAGDVLINNTDIALTKNNAATTMAVCVSGSTGSVVVNNSDIVVNAYPQGLWHQDENENWFNELKVSGITINQASNLDVLNTTVKLTATAADSVGATMPAITIKDQSSNINITNNTINSTGATYNYGIMCADYVNNLNVNYNNVNVTGIQYNAGMDISTSVNSNVKYNNITVNSTNTSVLSSGNEALAYGIITDTYQQNNSNNVVSYNNINLVANVAYGLENYMGSTNTFEYNNITINAKRGLGIATNASSTNNYKYNNIEINCNNQDVNNFYETIPAQNVGIIIIGANANYVQNNNITIHEDSTSTTTYAIVLADDTSSNTVKNNNLYVYTSNVISRYGQNAVANNITSNNVMFNKPTSISTINLNSNDKNIKKDEENTLIINSDNLSNYGMLNGYYIIITSLPSNTYVTLDVNSIVNSYSLVMIQANAQSTTLRIISDHHILLVSMYIPIIDTNLPYATVQGAQAGLINSVFFSDNGFALGTLENSTVFSLDDKYVALDSHKYSSYFDNATNILSDDVNSNSIIVLRNYSGNVQQYNNYNKPMIINKPVNITSFDNAIYNADITFIAGSEGSNITGLTLNGNLYINTSNINVKNNTIKKTVYVNEGSSVVIEENNFDTTETAIVIASGLENTIQNNNITTTSEYTITLDADSAENTITSNTLQAATLTGIASVHDEGEDNKITEGGDEPVVVEPELKVDTTEFTVGESATITASIYKGDEIDTTVNKGKVTFKVNGKTLKDASGKVIYAKVVNGTAKIDSYTVPNSWTKEGTVITAVYSGSTQCKKLTADTQTLTITKQTPTITTEDINTTKGETVTLKATITDGTNPINTGKVVFKVNGKTVKDANGKVIYAKVTNGTVSVEYTIPEDMKANNYNITVVFTAVGYDKLTDTKILTVA